MLMMTTTMTMATMIIVVMRRQSNILTYRRLCHFWRSGGGGGRGCQGRQGYRGRWGGWGGATGKGNFTNGMPWWRYSSRTTPGHPASIFSSADPQVSSAELMVLLICPLSVVVCRPSVNFCFKSLLLIQFLFDHSEFFTGETRHIVPPCNKAGISNFFLEFQKFQKFQISWKRYSSFSSYSIILKFILEKLGI